MSNCVEAHAYLLFLVLLATLVVEHRRLDLNAFVDGVVDACLHRQVVRSIFFAAALQHDAMMDSRREVCLVADIQAGEMQSQPVLVLLRAHAIEQLLHE